jgi:DNA-binding CsgD family transcriptional regulator
LIDRDTETAALAGALDSASGGIGELVVIQGPAGIGKTVLLGPLRDRATELGFTILSARASELDRAFGYGIVHQLVEPTLAAASPERRAALLSGAAGRAEAVLAAAGEHADDGGYAVVHALYWLLANIAEDAPLLIIVDDLHWADAPSLRLLEYLGRRLEGLPILVVGTARENEPGAAIELLGEITSGPYAWLVEPGPLGVDGVRAFLSETLGDGCDPAFVESARKVTAGNPLLLRVVAREAQTLGLTGTAGEGDRLGALAARGVVPIVTRRLHALGEGVIAVARSAAVAGERALVGDISALAAQSPAATREALDALASAGILDPGGWTFVHPLVKAAVLESAPTGAVMDQHRIAAGLLRERGARPAEVALHWLATDPAGNPETVADLRASAALSASDGATDVAVQHLRRALAEPPPEDERALLELELGELETRAQLIEEGQARLEALIASGALGGNDRARARAAIGNQLVHTDPVSALDQVAQAMEEATDPALRLRLEAFTLEALIFPNVFAELRDARFAEGRAEERPSPVMLAHLAVDGGCAGLPAADVKDLAERALADGTLMASVGPASSTYNLVTHAFRFAEEPTRCAQVLKEGERLVRELGLTAAQGFIDQSWGYWHRDFGSIEAGVSRARLGLQSFIEMGLELTVPALAAITAENLIHLGKHQEAAELIDIPLGLAVDTYLEPFALTTRGYVRHLLGRHAEAEVDLRRLVQLCDDRGWHAPNATRARLRLAEVLIATDRSAEARALMDEDLAVARAAGLRGAEGAALRIRARAQLDDADAIATLHDAIAVLRDGPYQLELGWTLHDLGVRLRASGDDVAAREPLREALDLAAPTESLWLAETARQELQNAGARPRRERLSGTDALTPAERRTAELAAEGLTNRQIAETLWVTLKTVEVHLGRTYAKLGIRSRRELADVLGPVAVAA